MNILNTKHLGLSILILLAFCLNLNAQKPRKIFNYLQENQLTLAVEEYGKITLDKEYDNEDKVLFTYAKCLFQIDTNYQEYNPTQAIKDFNGTYISSENRESIYKFLGKYNLSPEIISDRIHRKNYLQAKKINTVESYKNALEVCSFQYKEELTSLLENETFKNACEKMNIIDFNVFIETYPLSLNKDKAILIRDSLGFGEAININTIKSYNTYLQAYPNNKFKKKVLNIIDSLAFVESKNQNSIISFSNYINNYKEGKYLEKAITIKDSLTINNYLSDKSIDTLVLFIHNNPNNRFIKQLIDTVIINSIRNHNYNNLDLLYNKCTIPEVKDSILNLLYSLYVYDYEINELTINWFIKNHIDFKKTKLTEDDLNLYGSINWLNFLKSDTTNLKKLLIQTAPYKTSIKTLKFLISPFLNNKQYDYAYNYANRYSYILSGNIEYLKLLKELKNKTFSPEIRYFVQKNNDGFLNTGIPFVIVNGVKQKIKIDEEQLCRLELICQKDFDNNGILDAIFMFDPACGGNAGGSGLFLCSIDKNGDLIISRFKISGWLKNINIEKSNFGWSIIIKSNSVGFGNDELNELDEQFSFNEGKLSLISVRKKEKIPAVFEVSNDIFNGNENTEIIKYFDLDNDGINEKFEFRYWLRWGSIICKDAELSKTRKRFKLSTCKRFGILDSETNGVRDIVIDLDDVYYWDGNSYLERNPIK
jgi:hypothetical protein